MWRARGQVIVHGDRVYLRHGSERARLIPTYHSLIQHVRLRVRLPDMVIPLNPGAWVAWNTPLYCIYSTMLAAWLSDWEASGSEGEVTRKVGIWWGCEGEGWRGEAMMPSLTCADCEPQTLKQPFWG